jgi:flagellar protein FliO/FliZ
MDILAWLLFIIVIAALLAAGGLLLRGYLTTGSPSGALKDALAGNFFGPKSPKRLDVVDQTNVDGRRRLVLIRRDDIEHLIMTGGPVDLVIETGIEQSRARPAPSSEVIETSPAVYKRPARALGQAVGDQ